VARKEGTRQGKNVGVNATATKGYRAQRFFEVSSSRTEQSGKEKKKSNENFEKRSSFHPLISLLLTFYLSALPTPVLSPVCLSFFIAESDTCVRWKRVLLTRERKGKMVVVEEDKNDTSFDSEDVSLSLCYRPRLT
jgi:hypothetical protein